MPHPAPSTTRVVTIVVLTRFIDAIGFGALIPLAPTLMLSFGADVSKATWASSIWPLSFVLVAPIVGRLSDRHGRLRPIQIATLIGAIGHLIVALDPNLTTFIVSRILVSVGATSAIPAGAVLADISTVKTRAKMMSLRQVSFTLGLIVGPGVGALAGSADARGIFPVMAALGLLNLVAVLFMTETLNKAADGPANDEVREGRRARSLLIWGGCAAVFFSSLAYTLVYIAQPLVIYREYVAADFGLIASDSAHRARMLQLAGIAVAVSTISAAIAQMFLATKFTDSGRLNAKLSLLLIAWATNLGVTPLALTWGYPFLLATIVVTGTLYGFFMPAVSTLLSKASTPQEQGATFAAMEVAAGVATAVAPLLSGVLVESGTPLVYRTAFTFMLLAFIAWAAVPVWQRLTGRT